MKSRKEDWIRYQQTKDISLRNKLIEENLPLTYKIANDMYKRYIGFYTRDDIISFAYFGLIDAVIKYKPIKAFSTYATVRIKGAIKDFVKSEAAYHEKVVVTDTESITNLSNSCAYYIKDPTWKEFWERESTRVVNSEIKRLEKATKHLLSLDSPLFLRLLKKRISEKYGEDFF